MYLIIITQLIDFVNYAVTDVSCTSIEYLLYLKVRSTVGTGTSDDVVASVIAPTVVGNKSANLILMFGRYKTILINHILLNLDVMFKSITIV